MSEKKKKQDDTPFVPDMFQSPTEKFNAQIIAQSIAKRKTTDAPQSLTQRQYFKPADFSKLQETYQELDKWNTALVKLLRATPAGNDDGVRIKRLSEKAFENLKDALHNFITLWNQRTAGFLGTKDDVKQVYRLLIDEAKGIMTLASPPSRQQLEVVVISMKSIQQWLISQAFPFSVGEITQVTHPQLFNLEKTQLMAQGPGVALAEAGVGRFKKLRKKLPFARGKSPYEDMETSGLKYLPASGGND